MNTENNFGQSDSNHDDAQNQKSNSAGNQEQSDRSPKPVTGEAMVDSMSETAPNNDNTKIPEAEQVSDEQGKLDTEKFKETYDNPDEIDPTR